MNTLIDARGWSALSELVFNIAFAAAVVASAYWLFHFRPVLFTMIITEDGWLEYFGAVSFAVAGTLLMVLAARPGGLARRALWIALGVGFVLVAGEEISWGQRIFDIATPEPIREMNMQGEITLHNLEQLQFVFSRI